MSSRLPLLCLALLCFRSAVFAAPDPAAAVLQADTDFCQLCVQKGMAAAFTTYMADDGAMLDPGEPPVIGKAAIRAAMAGTEKLALTWKPLKGEVAASGELGYTYGTFELRSPGPDGKTAIATGKYMTVWRKQPSGAWKAIADIGNHDPAPVPPKAP